MKIEKSTRRNKRKLNKRKGIRKVCAVPIEAQAGTVFESFQTVDIGPGGAGFISNRKIPLNETIAVELDLTREEDPILVVGQVKWIRKMPDSEHYRVGMKFIQNLLPHAKSCLKKHLQP